MSETSTQATPARGRRLAILSFGALGVVYGDIGTSPLYAVKEAFSGPYGISPTSAHILGVLSLIFWSLILIVVLKYLTFIMRADNRGEGGILALLALVSSKGPVTTRRRFLLTAIGLFGATLLYGDGIITPAISVLGAMEGLSVAAPRLGQFVVPITVTILVALFLLQSRGTARVGALFAPITLIWFVCIATWGILGIARNPQVLTALNPMHGMRFFAQTGGAGFLVLGAVFLVVTGSEALYADMGHFGPRPIRLAWFAIPFPALLLNYFGQGALLISEPEAAVNPFYLLVPSWFLYPMLGVATAAAVVASQALISGSFSLTQQAVQLGYSPRVNIVHTSAWMPGQIYVPEVNWALMLACVALVIGFGDTSRLAAAYGIAVTGTMIITSILFFVVARERWKWSMTRAVSLVVLFLAIELMFFGANVFKIAHGGWLPIIVAALVFTLMSTWKRGRELLAENFRMRSLPLELFIRDIAKNKPPRVPGTAVFMTRNPEGVPPVLLHHLKHNKVLHERLVLFSVVPENIPHVPEAERLEVQSLGEGVYQVTARAGFMENPRVPALLEALKPHGLEFKLADTTFYLGRETLIPTRRPGMARWRKKLFALMSKNARTATAFFDIPPNRVVELGAQIEM